MLHEPTYVTLCGKMIAAAAALLCFVPRQTHAGPTMPWDGIRLIAFVSGVLALLILASTLLEERVLRDMLRHWSETSSAISGVARPTLTEVGRMVAASRPLTAALAVAGWSSITIGPPVATALSACASHLV